MSKNERNNNHNNKFGNGSHRLATGETGLEVLEKSSSNGSDIHASDLPAPKNAGVMSLSITRIGNVPEKWGWSYNSIKKPVKIVSPDSGDTYNITRVWDRGGYDSSMSTPLRRNTASNTLINSDDSIINHNGHALTFHEVDFHSGGTDRQKQAEHEVVSQMMSTFCTDVKNNVSVEKQTEEVTPQFTNTRIKGTQKQSSLAVVESVFEPSISTANKSNVHSLLKEAKKAYDSWNIPLLEIKLKKAYNLAPHRIDILYSIALAQVWKKNVDDAIDTYAEILEKIPDDVVALTYLAIYKFAKYDTSNNPLKIIDNAEFKRLEIVRPERAADVKNIIRIVQQTLNTPVVDVLPDSYKNKKEDNLVIVTLGYALEENGSMAQTLIDRLDKTREISNVVPYAKIIVTGGVPKNNKNEGIEMKQWLINKGLPPANIIDENYARDTVENMIYSRYIIDILKADNIILISSGTHVRRAKAILDVLSWNNGRSINVQMIAALDKPLSELQSENERKLVIYRDALRAYGLHIMRTAPELIDL